MIRSIAFAVCPGLGTIGAGHATRAPSAARRHNYASRFRLRSGMTRVNGVCVARSTIRQARRCVRWAGGACAIWQ
jgi:hypothetical protein